MKNFKKIISLIIINCFLLSFVYGELLAVIISDAKSDNNYKQIFTDFVLPYSYGQITSSHFASTDRVIINIQDLHCHPKVQKNISNIIELFDKQYGVKNIYLEGAYGDVDTQWLKQTTETTVKNQLIDKMIETGRLTGAEYYSLINGRTNIIKGLESKEAYLENLQRFGGILENKEKIELILKVVRESTQNLKTKYYERRQLKLEDLSNEYTSGKIGADKYFKLLAKHIDKLGIDLTKYENTINYIQLLLEQKTLNFEQTTKELQALVMILKQKLPYAKYKMLLDSTENFSKMDRLYGYVVTISRQYNLDLKVNFPELDRYFQYIELSQKINPLELIREESRLTNEINIRFSTTRAQREVVFLVNFEKYLENYLTSKITAEDYEYYLENMNTYKQLWNKYVDTRVLSLLDEYLAEADKFYKVNTDRNKYFADNIFNGIETSGIEPKEEQLNEITKIMDNMDKVKRVDIIVTGGFHTESVSKILKDNNVSYMVITPNVTGGIKLAEETYYKIAKEQSKISFQALALMSLSLQVMILKEQGIPLETIKKTLITDTNSDLMPLIESAFNGKIKIQDTETLVKSLNELTTETKFAGMLNFDEQGNIKEAVSKLLGTDVSVLEYINIDKLIKSWKNNDFKTLKKLTEDAKLRQDLSVNGTYIEKTFAELIIALKNISELTDGNVVNCAVEAVYSVLNPVTRPQKTILALQMKAIEIAEKIYTPKGYTSLYAMWQILKNDGYNAYEADRDILNKALNTAKPVILAVSSNGITGEVNHYITVTLLENTNSVVIKDSNLSTRIVAIEDLFVLLEQNYGWQNNTNILISYKLEGQIPVSSEKMKKINGATTNISDKPDITLEQQIEAIYDYTGTDEYVNVYLEDMLTDEQMFLATVKSAFESNKLISIHILREDYNSDLLTEEELLKKYKAIKKIIKNFSNLEKIFPNIKQIFEMPTAYSINFFLSEMLKNAFVHGNQGNNDPIIMYLKFNENDEIKTLSVYNLQKDSEMNEARKKLATKAGLTGYHIGTSIMLLNYFRTFKSGVRQLNGIKFYVATSELRKHSPNILKNQNIEINNFFEKHVALSKIVKTTMEIISTVLKLAGIIWVPLTLMSLFGSQTGVILTLILTGVLGFCLVSIQDIINKKSGQTIKHQGFWQKVSGWLQITQVSSVIVVEWQVQFIYNIFLRIIEKIQYVLSAEDELFEKQINTGGSISLKIKNTSENYLTGFLFKTLDMTADYNGEKQTIWQKIVAWAADYISPLLFAKWLKDIDNLSIPSVKNNNTKKRLNYIQDDIKSEIQTVEKTKDLLREFRKQFKNNIDYIEHFLKVSEERKLTDSEKNSLASNMNIVETAVEFLLMESIYIDSYTKGHAEHVATVSLLISKNIKSNLKEKYEPYFESYLKMVALLHDIGKNSIPNNILNKPGQLSDVEYELMKQHTSVGAEILNETGFGFLTVDVKNHHEKYDGTGYEGLSGDQISLVSSIVGLADSYDSMSRDRVYRERH
ncbi:MAG: HD domain-containing protein [Endomicrobiaceae bacterium]|nr:HD domain-containing protein [Endomicrobiaceae bacterium]